MADGPTSDNRIVRDAGFARRLAQACDAHVLSPKGYGQLRWFANEVGKSLGKDITSQTVSRWFKGEAKPRKETSDHLARILGVDSLWLYMGVGENLPNRERKIRTSIAEGAVNIVAGMIQMDGAHPAFPEEGDKRATFERVNLYAIIKGANYAFHVSNATPVGQSLQFTLPSAHENIMVLALLRDGFCYRVFEIPADLIEKHGTVAADGIILTVTEDQLRPSEITTFTKRL